METGAGRHRTRAARERVLRTVGQAEVFRAAVQAAQRLSLVAEAVAAAPERRLAVLVVVAARARGRGVVGAHPCPP